MKAFLEELAAEMTNSFGNQLEEFVFVFPNKRSGLFFQKYLSSIIKKPVWSPEVLPIEAFIRSLSSLRQADHALLVFELFRIYKKLAPSEESFDKFFFWGEMLLADFDTVDKYLADADTLFLNISQLKELDTSLDYLSPEQVETIRSFWESFSTERSRHQKEFIAIWEILPQVYQQFRELLEQQGIAYEGMIYRQVAFQAAENQLQNPHKQVVFAGFDALTPAEEKIMAYYVQHEGALVYWNTDAYYMLDERQEAGAYLRAYARHKVLGKTFRQPYRQYLQNPDLKKHIEFIGVPLEVGQAKAMGEKLLSCLQQQIHLRLEETAIVLPEEHLLFPALHAIPHEFLNSQGKPLRIDNINVSMGYPLRNTPLYSLMENLLELLQSVKTTTKAWSFYYRPLLAVLRHPYVYFYNEELAAKNIHWVAQRNKVYISTAELQQDQQLYPIIFRKVEKINAVFDYLLDVLMAINSSINEENFDDPALEQEYIYQFFTQLKRLRELIGQQSIALSLPVFLKLFRQIMTNLRLPFSGEPLRGLQLMGVLETRNLDFENLFILSMNEGSFPPAAAHASFIPYNLRKGYGLPTHEREEAIYAYLFYSMIQRARNIHIFYNTETGFKLNGEMSRYLYQLMYESGLPIQYQILSSRAQLAKSLPILIPKTPEVYKILYKYIVKADSSGSRLTPSALNIYLDCRLKFYFKYVAGIQEAEEVQEEVKALEFGNILHSSMEQVYKKHMQQKNSKRIEKQDFAVLKKLSKQVIDQAFSLHYGEEGSFDYEGKNLIARPVAQKFVDAILDCDQQYAPFEIISLEAEDSPTSEGFRMDLAVKANGKILSIGLKGIIDRVDRKDGKVRIIDYKTGRDHKRIASIASLFDRHDKRRNKAAMQILFYALLYLNKYPNEEASVMPGLYNSKELFSKDFDIKLEIQVEKNKYSPLWDVRPLAREFSDGLRELLAEIYNPAVAFDQTKELGKCGVCSFRGVCHR